MSSSTCEYEVIRTPQRGKDVVKMCIMQLRLEIFPVLHPTDSLLKRYFQGLREKEVK